MKDHLFLINIFIIKQLLLSILQGCFISYNREFDAWTTLETGTHEFGGCDRRFKTSPSITSASQSVHQDLFDFTTFSKQ